MMLFFCLCQSVGMEVNLIDAEGATPLFRAAEANKMRILGYLIRSMFHYVNDLSLASFSGGTLVLVL